MKTTRRSFIRTGLLIWTVLIGGFAACQASDTKSEWVLPAVDAPRLQQRILDSAALGGKVSYQIYIPEIYDAAPERRFPVLYWLHGHGGGSAFLPQLVKFFDAAMRAGKIPPMLIVFPNGLADSMWCDSKDGTVPMETIVVKELLPQVDAAFHTIATREGRLVEGFSMGGYGAARLGFKFPELFGAVSLLGAGPLQPDFRQTPPGGGVQGHDQVYKDAYSEDADYFKAQSPWMLAEQNADSLKGKTQIRQVVGDRDSMLPFNRDFDARLTQLGIPHDFIVPSGIGHNALAVFEALGAANWKFYQDIFGVKSFTDSPAVENFQLNGERWTCTADGKPLSGIMIKPDGSGPFPAIILSHGLGGNAQNIIRSKGRELVQLGFVCIATDYTHAGQGGGGRGAVSNVDFSQAGARPENIRRALACMEILRQQKTVDPRRIAAYGHSMGAFVTIALAAAAPDKLTAAAITSGGIQTAKGSTAAAPAVNVAAQVRVPFLILQGAIDNTVPPESSALFKQALDANKVPNERHVFDGTGHNVPTDRADEVNRLMKEWFVRFGVLPPVKGSKTK